ncbi:MAG: hypothetical protein PUB42_01945 [Firmicutes bacterium]|nr:hypothetical protein [Bacillota bacterium]
MTRKYFVRANTSAGCVNLAENNFEGISKVYAVNGRSKSAKTELMSLAANHFELKDTNVECIVSPFDITKLDGVVLRDSGVALMDRECLGSVAAIQEFSADELIRKGLTEEKARYLADLEKKAQKAYTGMYSAFSEGKAIHDEWEQIYITQMNFEILNDFGDRVIKGLVKPGKPVVKGGRYSRFFGASTPDGSVNYINNLTENLSKRYFIKGRPGTGKSTFLKRLADALQNAGHDVEVYYCSFDPNSLDMVLARDLSFCVFDSTAPHEMFPSESRDSVLDFYKEAGLDGVDEQCAKELALVKRRYQYRVSEGLCNLRMAQCFENEIEYNYGLLIDARRTGVLADKIIRQISE